MSWNIITLTLTRQKIQIYNEHEEASCGITRRGYVDSESHDKIIQSITRCVAAQTKIKARAGKFTVGLWLSNIKLKRLFELVILSRVKSKRLSRANHPQGMS